MVLKNLLFTSLLLISSYSANSQTRLNQIHSNKSKRSLDLNGGLHLLNLCQQKPEYIKEIYTSAFNILSGDPKANFPDLAKDPDFLRLCAMNGFTHSGGPMLGNISQYGANVWLRTLQPASVEIRINVHGTVKTYGPTFSSENTDMTAIVKVTGLKPGTIYPYHVFIDGKPINIDKQAYITTLPPEDIQSKTSIAFGTCFHR